MKHCFSGKWKRTNTGFPSTAGTTASIAVLFQNKLFVAHVGDSGVILGQEDGPRGDKKITAIKLTKVRITDEDYC